MPGDPLRHTVVRPLSWVLLVTTFTGTVAINGTLRADDVLVTVNRRPITEADLQLEAVLRRVPDKELDSRRESLLETLIDQEVMAAFLAQKRVQANSAQLDSEIERIHALIRRGGEEPEALLSRIGLDQDQVRKRVSLSLAWREYVRRVTTDEQLREHFQKHRRELDGTQLRARHILLKANRDDAQGHQAARESLAELREQIEAEAISFEAAAARNSQAPSSNEGGDVGFFAFRGTMPPDFADAAFALNSSEISQPVETAFGVHLIQVTDERPGQLSLEDVRTQVLGRISQKLWEEQLARERPRATITQ